MQLHAHIAAGKYPLPGTIDAGFPLQSMLSLTLACDAHRWRAVNLLTEAMYNVLYDAVEGRSATSPVSLSAFVGWVELSPRLVDLLDSDSLRHSSHEGEVNDAMMFRAADISSKLLLLLAKVQPLWPAFTLPGPCSLYLPDHITGVQGKRCKGLVGGRFQYR